MQRNYNKLDKTPPTLPKFNPFYFEYGLIHGYFSIEQVAKWAHVHPKTAAKWANGSQKPHASTLELIELRATKRIMPNDKTWLCCYFADNQKLSLPDGEEVYPQHFYMNKLTQSLNIDIKNELQRERQKLDAVINSKTNYSL